MLALFGVLIIIASVVLGLIVLIQNPKGGGLSGTFGGLGNQLMGVKQTTDVLEKGTWVFAAVVGLLCLMSPAFIPKEGTHHECQQVWVSMVRLLQDEFLLGEDRTDFGNCSRLRNCRTAHH